MTAPGSEPQPYSELIPRPDPTVLTTQAVDKATDVFRRDIAALRELHDKDLAAMKSLLDARLAGMDQDRSRLWERMHELPAQQETASNHFRDEVGRRDAASRELIEQRLADLDKARALAARQMEKFLEEARETHRRMRETFAAEMTSEREFILAQLEVNATRMAEKFAAVDSRFQESKDAVAAALSAAKEAGAETNKANDRAITKSEAGVKEQLTSLGQVADASFKAMEDKIGDARDRLTAVESRTAGIQQGASSLRATRDEQRAEHSLTTSMTTTVFIGLALLVSVVSILVSVFHK